MPSDISSHYWSASLAFAGASEPDTDEVKNYIARAGLSLTHSSKFDIIVEDLIKKKNYHIYKINAMLFEFDQFPLGGSMI